MQVRRIVKLGSTVAIRIPKVMVKAMGLRRGDYVVLKYPRPGFITLERLELPNAHGTDDDTVPPRPDRRAR